jgi:hypothetical protein
MNKINIQGFQYFSRPDVVATEMMKMIEEFRNKYRHSRLSEIRIVIYRDEGIYMVIF